MIAEKTIKDFLHRELDNFEWVKALSPAQVKEALSETMPPFLADNLWLHQKASLLIMQHQSRFMFTIGMGGGKSLTMLTMLRHRKINGEKLQVIVLVPYLTAIDTWLNETEKWAPELTCHPLLGTTKENLKDLQTKQVDIFIACYQSMVALMANRTTPSPPLPLRARAHQSNTHRTKWTLDYELVQSTFNNFDTLILDECHKTKSHNSLTFELCKYISNKATYVYGLTGTPFGDDLQDLWAEFYVIDFGETLGPNISFYRNVFFTRKAGFFGGMEFKFQKKYMKHLQRMIKNKSIHYSVKDFADMPEKQYVQRHISLPEAARVYVERARNELYEARKNKDVEVAGNAFMQLRQLSSGFITFKDEQDRLKVRLDDNPKLDILCELIEAMPPECKMVVFHDYVFTNQLISDRLKELKISHTRIWGGQRDQLGQLKKFREDEHCKILVINSRSGSSALNLQNANYITFFECPSVIDREQAEARCWRPGQKNKVIIYDLFVRGTVDESHYNAIKAGGDFLTEFLSGKKELGLGVIPK